MAKSRIVWALWILAAVIFWFFTDEYSGILLLVGSIVLPLLLGILTKQSSKKLCISIHVESSGGKGQFVKGAVNVNNKSWIPAGRVVCIVRCENLMTGEVFRKSVRVGVPGHGKVSSEFEFASHHCGRLKLSVPQLTIYDPLGIFRFRRQNNQSSQVAKTFIRPDTFPLEVQIAYGESMSLDSDEYSMQKAGFDPSETFAIREYMPGDRIKQIHWKLSEKMDNLMVREYGLPIQNTILLLLETGVVIKAAMHTGHVNENGLDAACMDALGEAIISLSQELIQQQIIHSLGWYNHEENSFYCVEITCQEELSVAMPELLGTAPQEDSLSVLGHYLEGREQCEFAHVVILAPYHVGDIAAIEDQCLITEVLCEKDGGGGYANDSARILSVNPESIADDLAYVEI